MKIPTITTMKRLYFILISFLLISCSFNQTFSNKEKDKNGDIKIVGYRVNHDLLNK
ncbi:hypothetical protein [Chryseobacterium vrystaatense]|nr:hypothetical protein [Chryseobacterium vrystaatense]